MLWRERRRKRDPAEGRDRDLHHNVGHAHEVVPLATTKRDHRSPRCLVDGDDFTAQLNALTKLGRDTPWQEIVTPIDLVLEGCIMLRPWSLV
jgi:hypothetical protein